MKVNQEPDPRTDHLVLASPDLVSAVAEIESLLGVTPTPGGSHPDFGTRNALVSLGQNCYLEIIGPDPHNSEFRGTRPFGIDDLVHSRLVTWAVRETDLDRRFESSRSRGYDPGHMVSGARRRPDGEMLEWRLGIHPGFLSPGGEGVVPFLIDWGSSPHPSETAVPGCRLESLRAAHPDPESIFRSLEALEIGLPVSRGPVALIATIESPRGSVELSGGRNP